MFQILESLGFSEIEAQIYIYLVKEGPRNSKYIAENLKIQRLRIYHCLKKLQEKGFIKKSCEYPARFSPSLFEQVIDLLIKNNLEQAKYVMQKKEQLLSGWRSIIRDDCLDI